MLRYVWVGDKGEVESVIFIKDNLYYFFRSAAPPEDDACQSKNIHNKAEAGCGRSVKNVAFVVSVVFYILCCFVQKFYLLIC